MRKLKSERIILALAPYSLKVTKYRRKLAEACLYVRDCITMSPAKAKLEKQSRDNVTTKTTLREIHTNSSVIGIMINRLTSIAEHHNRKVTNFKLWAHIYKTLTGDGNSKDIELTIRLMSINDPALFLSALEQTGDITPAMKQFYGEYPAARLPCWNLEVVCVKDGIEIQNK